MYALYISLQLVEYHSPFAYQKFSIKLLLRIGVVQLLMLYCLKESIAVKTEGCGKEVKTSASNINHRYSIRLILLKAGLSICIPSSFLQFGFNNNSIHTDQITFTVDIIYLSTYNTLLTIHQNICHVNLTFIVCLPIIGHKVYYFLVRIVYQ